MLAACFAKLTIVVLDFPVAVPSAALKLRVLDQFKHALIILGWYRLRFDRPRIVTAGVYFQRQAQAANRIISG